MNYTQKIYLNNIITNNNMNIDSFTEAFTSAIKDYESKNGRRKQKIQVTVSFNDKDYVVEVNKTHKVKDNFLAILDNISSAIRNPFYHSNIERPDIFGDLMKNLIGYTFENGKLTFNFNKVDNYDRKAPFLNEIKEYFDNGYEYKKHHESIESDFSNNGNKENNIAPDMEYLNKYIDILIKYADIINLDKFKNIHCTFRYMGDLGSQGRPVNGNIDSLKSKLLDILSVVYKYSTDIVGIYPNKLDIYNPNGMEYNDYLSFGIMESDRAIAVHKYLSEQKSKAMENIYGCGKYTGD